MEDNNHAVLELMHVGVDGEVIAVGVGYMDSSLTWYHHDKLMGLLDGYRGHVRSYSDVLVTVHARGDQ